MFRVINMMLDVSELLRKKVAKKKISLVLPQDSILIGNVEVSCSKSIELDGTISMAGDILSLDGRITTELSMRCCRCIEKFIYPVDIKIHEEFSNNSDNRDENVIFIDSDNIDITEIVENNIVMDLPMKKLCSESCKGLCQHCGTNLNKSSCNCDDSDVDPRLAKLKDMFLTD